MISRRCLICANINPCSLHSGREQASELARNDAAIARIRAEERAAASPLPASTEAEAAELARSEGE